MLYVNEPKASLYTGIIHEVVNGGYELYIPRVSRAYRSRYIIIEKLVSFNKNYVFLSGFILPVILVIVCNVDDHCALLYVTWCLYLIVIGVHCRDNY